MHLNRYSQKRYFTVLLIFLFAYIFLFATLKTREKEPNGRKNIFFVETRSPKDGIGFLKPRQACTIESAAISNPDWDVFLYFLDVNVFRDDEYWRIVRSLPNVNIKQINAVEFSKGTPTETLLKKGLKTHPEWLVSHTSDVLRYTTLYKYAGVYMDLDIISLRSLNGLAPNFAGQQELLDEILAGSAIVGFADDGVGRELATAVAEDIAQNFTGEEWDVNGLGTLTRGIEQLCGTTQYAAVNVEKCKGFRLYSPELFYSIPYYGAEVFFNSSYYDEGMDLIQDSVVTHLWNYLSYNVTAEKGSHTVLCEVAKKYCPKTFEVGNKFCL